MPRKHKNKVRIYINIYEQVAVNLRQTAMYEQTNSLARTVEGYLNENFRNKKESSN